MNKFDIPSVLNRYDLAKEMATEAARERAAFSFDTLKFEERACGYIHEGSKFMPSKISIPSSLYAMPISYVNEAAVAAGDQGEMFTNDVWYGKKALRYELKSSSNVESHLCSDFEFTVMNMASSRMLHCTSSQPRAVREQPDWVCYAMNMGRLHTLAERGVHNWEVSAGTGTEAIEEHINRLDFVTKGLQGAVRWLWCHADLIFQAPCTRSVTRMRNYLVRELRDCIDASGSDHNRLTHDEIQAFVTKHKGMDGRFSNRGGSMLSFWSFVRKELEAYLRQTRRGRDRVVDLGRDKEWGDVALAVEGLAFDRVRYRWLLTFFDRMVEKGIVQVGRGGGFSTTTTFRMGVVESYLAPERFANCLGKLGERYAERGDTLRLDFVRGFLMDHATELVKRELAEEAQDADLWYGMADAALCLSETHEILGGGHLQQREGWRYARACWPHILNKHPDRRRPQMREVFGDFQVSELDTAKEPKFSLEPSEIKALCDDDGDFLHYNEAVAVLKRVYNDFDGTTKDLDEFIAGLMEEHGDAEWIGRFEEFMRCYLKDDVAKAWYFEIETDHFWPVLKDSSDIDSDGKKPYSNTDGEDNEHAIAFKYTVGCDVFEAIYLPAHEEYSPQEQVRRAAAGSVYNGYSDVGKMCWLRYRGLIGDGDEVYGKEWNPFNDLKPNMARDFVDWCFEVPDVDGWAHELSRYDGEGTIWEPAKKSNGETAASGKHEFESQGWGFCTYREG